MTDPFHLLKPELRTRRRDGDRGVDVEAVRVNGGAPGWLRVEARGRWRSAPAGPPPPAVLVVDDGERTHRFTALPAAGRSGPPPAPERFFAAFRVPDALREPLAGPLVMFVGGRAVALPRAEFGPAPAAPPDPALLAERRARRAELSEREHAERAARAERELEQRRREVEELGARLEAAERERDALGAELGARLVRRERELRDARQRAHAEQRLREEVAGSADERVRRHADEADAQRLRALGLAARADRLEVELETLRRAEAEAQQAAAAADASRHRMRLELADALARLDSLEQHSAEPERELPSEPSEPPAPGPAEPAASAPEPPVASPPDTPAPEPDSGFRRHLEAERAARRGPADGPAEKEAFAAVPADGPAPAPEADEVTVELDAVIGGREPDGPAVEADAEVGSDWLVEALPALARRDPDSAIRLALALLPIQASLAPVELDYDLEAGGSGWYRVRHRADGAGEVIPLERPRRDAGFRVRLDAEALAEMLVQGAPGARPGVRARLRGGRQRASLPAIPMRFDELAARGALVEPAIALRALATGIAAEWTRGHDFCVAYEVADPGGPDHCVYVVVRDGRPVTVRERPPGAVHATVRSSWRAWTAMLSGRSVPPGDLPVVEGDAGAAALLATWARRAQGVEPEPPAEEAPVAVTAQPAPPPAPEPEPEPAAGPAPNDDERAALIALEEARAAVAALEGARQAVAAHEAAEPAPVPPAADWVAPTRPDSPGEGETRGAAAAYALALKLDGASRAEVESRLRDEFGRGDAGLIADEAFGVDG